MSFKNLDKVLVIFEDNWADEMDIKGSKYKSPQKSDINMLSIVKLVKILEAVIIECVKHYKI